MARPRARLPGVRLQPRLRHQAARRVGRRRPRADPDHRHVGDRPAAPARVRQRHQPAARPRRRARARDGGSRRARRRARPHRPAAAHRVGAARRRRARCSALLLAYVGVRALLALGASKLPRLDAVTFDGRVLLFALAALVVSGAAGRVRARAAARRDGRAHADEREQPLDERRPRHGALAERDDGRGDCAGDHARRRRRLAGARLRQPSEHASSASSPTSA